MSFFLQVLPHLTPSVRTRVAELQRKIASLRDIVRSGPSTVSPPETDSPPGEASPGGGGTKHKKTAADKLRDLRDALDDIVAEECFFCGDIIIRCVNRPFTEENSIEDMSTSWN